MSDSRGERRVMRRKHRWLRLSLRTFLALLTVGCVWLGLVINQVHERRNVIQWITDLGGVVYYDYELPERGNVIKDARPPAPDWMCNLVGIDVFANVVYVRLKSDRLRDVTPLTELEHLRVLILESPHSVDVLPLADMETLEWLVVGVQHSREDHQKLKEALPECAVGRTTFEIIRARGG